MIDSQQECSLPLCKVCVRCLTYNHSQFIKDAMDGFCVQKTNFPYVCVIVDDYSQDGEPDIIKQYLHDYFQEDVGIEENDDYVSLFARHKTNNNCFFHVFFLKYNFYQIKKSKAAVFAKWDDVVDYVALCEGDDYWTYPEKLQEQVDFMDGHKDFSMCFGDVLRRLSKKNIVKGRNSDFSWVENRNLEKIAGGKLFYKLLCGDYCIQTLTVLYRVRDKKNIPKNAYGFMMGDTPLWIDLSIRGGIKYIDKVFGVYNIHGESVSHNKKSRIRFELSQYEMRKYYCEKYGFKVPRSIDKKYNSAYFCWLFDGRPGAPAIYEPVNCSGIQNFMMKAYESHKGYKWIKCYLFFSRKLNRCVSRLKMMKNVVVNKLAKVFLQKR